MRHFIDETSRGEHVEVIRNGTEPSDADVCICWSVFGANVGNIVRKIGESKIQFETRRITRGVIESRCDRLERCAMQPCLRPAAVVHNSLVIDSRRCVIKVETDIILTSPDDLYRFPKFLRQDGSFRGV